MLNSLLGASRRLRLEHPGLYLRMPRASDWADWSRLRRESQEFLTPWEPSWGEESLTRSAYRRRLRRYQRRARGGAAYTFFIFTKPDHTLVGGITLSNVRRGVVQGCSMGYWMGERYAGRGLMSTAIPVVLDFAFAVLGLHRVEASCIPGNQASLAVLQKSGFREEGTAREYLRINGAWRDHIRYAILHGDARKSFN